MRKVLALPAVLAASAIFLSACGGSGGSATGTASTSPAAPQTTTTSATGTAGSGTTQTASAMITIKDFEYQVSGPVSPGEKVTVQNSDNVAHTVTADQSKSLFDVTIQPGHTATFTAPAKAGTYAFGCNFHGNMHGKLVVR